MIRPRLETDFPALIGAMRQVHEQDAYPSVWPADPLAFIAPPLTLGAWIAELDGEIVGQVVLKALEEPLPDWAAVTGLTAPELAVISRFFVAPAGRGKGLARPLFKRAWQEALQLGRRAVLDVHQKNLAAIALYESEGWKRVATLPAPFLDPDGSTPQVHVYASPPSASVHF